MAYLVLLCRRVPTCLAHRVILLDWVEVAIDCVGTGHFDSAQTCLRLGTESGMDFRGCCYCGASVIGSRDVGRKKRRVSGAPSHAYLW